MSNALEIAGKMYRDEYDKQKTIEDELDEQKRKVLQTEQQLRGLMLEAGMPQFKLDDNPEDVRVIFLKGWTDFRVVDKSRWPEVFEWLRETGNESLIRENVDRQTLKATVRIMEEDGIEIPDFIVKSEGEKAHIQRSRGRKRKE